MPESVIVVFPEDRQVLIDSNPSGRTNENLAVETGLHGFSLGGEQNYEPGDQEVLVTGTSVINPMRVTFTLEALSDGDGNDGE